MANIPCPFDWQPKYFRERGWHKDYKAWALITWAFSRCSPKPYSFYYINKEIHLEPFEFIFGRDKCSEETGLSPQEVRTQLKKLLDHKMIEKSTSKSTSKYTVYRWLMSQFIQNSNQQNNPASTSNQPAINHKQEAKEAIEVIEASSPRAPEAPEKIVSILEGWDFERDLRPTCILISKENFNIHYQTGDITKENLSDQEFIAFVVTYSADAGFSEQQLIDLRAKKISIERIFLGICKLTGRRDVKNPFGLLAKICQEDNFQDIKHTKSKVNNDKSRPEFEINPKRVMHF